MIHVWAGGVNLRVDFVVNLMMNLGVGMGLGMLDMGVNLHDLSGRRKAGGAGRDPHLQVIQSIGAKGVLFPHGCRTPSRTEWIGQRPPVHPA